MQRLDHRLELDDRVLDCVLRRGREPCDRVVAPVVDQSFLYEKALGRERLHRQQFDRRHAKMLQMRDDLRMRETQVRPALAFGRLRMKLREALDVRFIDHRVAPGRSRRAVVAPIEGAVNDARLVIVRRAVRRIELVVRLLRPAEQRCIPLEPPSERACIRIEQQLVRVVTQAVQRIVWPVRTQSVHQTGNAGGRRQKPVPHVFRALRQREPCKFAFTAIVEQTKLDARGAARVHREVDALACPARAQRLRRSGLQHGVRIIHGNCVHRAGC